ncbi:Protein of unknown function [Gryllus bimaculatus]|nr:Protein of unknown function [Gryllus bimaculatus]
MLSRRTDGRRRPRGLPARHEHRAARATRLPPALALACRPVTALPPAPQPPALPAAAAAAMYNLNVNVAPGAAGLLAVEGSCTTPKTPEILNSLIAMTR